MKDHGDQRAFPELRLPGAKGSAHSTSANEEVRHA
jgi:hypothetical protein